MVSPQARPARWVVALAAAALVVTALTFAVSPLRTAYWSYIDTVVDEEARAVDHFRDLSHVVMTAARSQSLAGLRRGEPAAHEVLEGKVKLPATYEFRNDAVYYARILVGRIALASGDVGGARRELLAATYMTETGDLHLFGPDMTLAQELIERGESAVVLEYFSACAKYWPDSAVQIQKWATEVSSGHQPDFGGFSGLLPPKQAA
jgi:hypothetical protein